MNQPSKEVRERLLGMYQRHFGHRPDLNSYSILRVWPEARLATLPTWRLVHDDKWVEVRFGPRQARCVWSYNGEYVTDHSTGCRRAKLSIDDRRTDPTRAHRRDQV